MINVTLVRHGRNAHLLLIYIKGNKDRGSLAHLLNVCSKLSKTED